MPDKDTCCGEPLAESVMMSVADFAPAETGVKKMEMLQEAPTASEVPQLFDCAKSSASPPVTAIEENVTEAVPTFVRVVDCAADLLPTVRLPKTKEDALTVRPGAGVPVPDKDTR